MNNNNLPPELVEKMKEACMGETYLDETVSNPLSEKCAQIAVYYADEWRNDQYQVQKAVNTELRKQRDELLTALIITNKRLFMALGEPEYNSFIDRNNKIIQKHKDGKE